MDTVEFLLSNACPSIVYRTKQEILMEHLSSREIEYYQRLILESDKVRSILRWQGNDGYFGSRLHTASTGSKIWTHEGCVRYLIEKGILINNNVLKKSLLALLEPGWEKEIENSRAASIFGKDIIRAALFAQAGLYDYDFVELWIKKSLQAFQHIAETPSFHELVTIDECGKYVFREKTYIPTIYHIRMLAYTYSWRNTNSEDMVMLALKKLYDWLPLPPVYYKSKSQFIAPLMNVAWPINCSINEKNCFWWLHSYELMARMGMLKKTSPFRICFDEINFADVVNQLKITKQWFNTRYKKKTYLIWSGYSGLALEDDWNNVDNQMYDLVFRYCLIHYYCNKD